MLMDIPKGFGKRLKQIGDADGRTLTAYSATTAAAAIFATCHCDLLSQIRS
jgi:hypothetical protein